MAEWLRLLTSDQKPNITNTSSHPNTHLRGITDQFIITVDLFATNKFDSQDINIAEKLLKIVFKFQYLNSIMPLLSSSYQIVLKFQHPHLTMPSSLSSSYQNVLKLKHPHFIMPSSLSPSYQIVLKLQHPHFIMPSPFPTPIRLC